MAAAESARVQEAQKLAKSDPRKAEAIYKEIISQAPGATSDAATREYETALVSLGELYRDEKCALPVAVLPPPPLTNHDCRKTQELVDLVKESRSVFSSFAKAKSAKLGMSPSSRASACALTASLPQLTR